MKFSRLNIVLSMLVFLLLGADTGDVQASQGRTGEARANLPSPINQGHEASFTADGLPYRSRELDFYQTGQQLAAANPSTSFQDECSQCHGDAEEFVRESLMFKNGVLTGQFTNKPLVNFLKTHQNLKPDAINFYSALLNRIAGEIGLQ